MNKLKGNITAIEVSHDLSIVTVDVDGFAVRSIVIETPETASYLRVGQPIHVLFKETEVVIGVGDVSNVSLQNKLPVVIEKVENGTLLSLIHLRFGEHQLVAVISSNAVEQLQLAFGHQVMAMVKLNEVMLSNE